MSEWLLKEVEMTPLGYQSWPDGYDFEDIARAQLRKVVESWGLREYSFGGTDIQHIYFMMGREEWQQLRKEAGLEQS